MLDVRRLRLLRDLAQLGTIAAVAQRRSYTASAVSQQLTALEREAGVALLERTGRGVTLTEAGVILVDHAEIVIAQLERASADLTALTGAVTGELRIGAFPSSVRPIATPAVVALGSEHPRLRVRIVEIDPARAAEALRTGALDLALLQNYDCFPDNPDPTLDTEPVLDEIVYIAARSTVELTELTAVEWISGTPGTLCDDATVRICENVGFAPNVRHRVDDFTAVLALVAAGQGVALVPEIATADVPEPVALTPLATRRRTSLACRGGTADDPRIRAGRLALHAAARQR